MNPPIDGPLYGWDEFVVFCSEEGISLEAEEDWFPWWSCWKRAFVVGHES